MLPSEKIDSLRPDAKTSFSTVERLAKRLTEPVIPPTELEVYVRFGLVSSVKNSKSSDVSFCRDTLFHLSFVGAKRTIVSCKYAILYIQFNISLKSLLSLKV